MIAVVWATLRSAPRRAAFLALLGAVAVAVAVAVPAYVASAEQAVIAAEVSAAPVGESTISIRRTIDEASDRVDQSFERLLPSRIAMTGFTAIFGTRFDAAPAGDGPAGWFLTYRDRMCEHVTIEAGRCAAGRGEMMIGPATAEKLKLGVGSAVPISQIEWIPVDGDRVPNRVGEPIVLSVVGVFQPIAPADPYWGPNPPFTGARPYPAEMEPLFVARDTARLFELEINENQAFDLVARKDALTAAWTARHQAELDRLTTAASEARGKVTAGTPPLIDRIEDSRAAVRSLVPWLVLPLVALCWYVILLAAASGAEAGAPTWGSWRSAACRPGSATGSPPRRTRSPSWSALRSGRSRAGWSGRWPRPTGPPAWPRRACRATRCSPWPAGSWRCSSPTVRR